MRMNAGSMTTQPSTMILPRRRSKPTFGFMLGVTGCGSNNLCWHLRLEMLWKSMPACRRVLLNPLGLRLDCTSRKWSVSFAPWTLARRWWRCARVWPRRFGVFFFSSVCYHCLLQASFEKPASTQAAPSLAFTA